jgi:hypothetical protein
MLTGAPLVTAGNISAQGGTLYLGPGPTVNLGYTATPSAATLRVSTNVLVDSTLYLSDSLHFMQIVGAATRYACQAGGVHSFEYSTGALGPCQATAFNVVSARKFKADIATLSDPLSLVMDERVHGVSYTERDTGKRKVGFVADDFLPVLPEVVALDPDGDVIAFDYDRMGAVTFEALKQFVHQTEARLAALENRT